MPAKLCDKLPVKDNERGKFTFQLCAYSRLQQKFSTGAASKWDKFSKISSNIGSDKATLR